jgi:ABC-type transport system involved in multi-copper enzyme maturation permease subunit
MPAAILARLVLVEARRGGLPWLAAGALAAALLLSVFLSQVALTEARALQLAVVAALLRACAVFLVAAQVSASVMREMNDKGLEHMLSLPLTRASHYLGRLAGHVLVAALLALVFALPLLLWASPGRVALWAMSLALEGALVAAAALFFTLTLAQPVSAIAATAGLYLLARSMAAIQAMAAGPLLEPSFANQAARFGVDAVALLLPSLDTVTRSDWLLYGAPRGAGFVAAVGALLVYIALLAAAGLFDFYRRSD